MAPDSASGLAPSTSLPPPRQARQRLQQTILHYTETLSRNQSGNPGDRSSVRASLDQLQSLETSLESQTLRVAVFGLVSRGKSAVINAIIGQPTLATGPTHGVTQWPRSVYWQLPKEEGCEQSWQVEFIDTPGLDEIDGAERSAQALSVANQADLILFVVAGPLTSLESQAMQQLQTAQKPLIIVFNKLDLYPEFNRDAIVEQLQQLAKAGSPTSEAFQSQPLQVEGVVGVAAAPASALVRTEWPDGRITEAWETPPPLIEPLTQTLRQIVRQDGALLVTLNALRGAREIESQLVSQISTLCQDEAAALIWRFARYKALIVALNPISLLDLLGGIGADLVMIRFLARLYGFPLTHYQASQLWRAILRSSGVLLLSEFASGLMGVGKTTATLLSPTFGPAGFTALTGAMIAQASAAGYGAYVVGQAARTYLEQGCTWGPEGVSAVMDEVLRSSRQSGVTDRLRSALEHDLQ